MVVSYCHGHIGLHIENSMSVTGFMLFEWLVGGWLVVVRSQKQLTSKICVCSVEVFLACWYELCRHAYSCGRRAYLQDFRCIQI